MSPASHFGTELSKRRRLLGLTQTELAAKLFVSPQTVSKWEGGISLPDLDNLCTLSDLLGVSIDSLLGRGQQGEPCIIGIDGGGTKTEFVLANTTGEQIDRFVLPGCNPNVAGVDGCVSILRDGIGRLLAANINVKGCFAGIAGSTVGDNRTRILKGIATSFPDLLFEVGGDIENVFGCRGMARGVAVICGTGTVVYVHDMNGLHRIGGYGYLFDQAGSGYDIGRDVLRIALEKSDGIRPASLLTDMTEEMLGGDAHDLLAEIYRRGKDYIASFAPIAFKASANGDPAASDILDRNFAAVNRLIDFAFKHYDCPNRIFFAGGLIHEQKAIRTRISGSYALDFIEQPPVFGACVRAVQRFVGEPDFNFEENWSREK